MYGRDTFDPPAEHKPRSRPLSFVPSPLGETIETANSFDPRSTTTTREPLSRTSSNEHRIPTTASERMATNTLTSQKPEMTRNGSAGNSGSPPATGPRSPPPLHRSSSETATQHFPLNDIDYESNPDAIVQELNNLQAIRRMSMDVNASDPDLPSFSSNFGVPAVAPSHNSDEEDPSRLFWVPARLHPELAPKEFKTFIQDRVKTIKRSSLGDESLSPGQPAQSAGSLRRKKSMLSRQVNDANGYEDGAERLERKRSQSGSPNPDVPAVNLQELEQLVEDPSSLVRRLSLDTTRSSLDSAHGDVQPTEDMPMLPPKPAGQTLKRSTRTNYRRGSLKRGERVLGSRRAALRQDGATSPTGDQSDLPRLPEIPDVHQFGLSRVQTEPLPQTDKPVENFSRPGRRAHTPPVPQRPHTAEDVPQKSVEPPQIVVQEVHHIQNREPFHSRIASNGRTTANFGLPGQGPSLGGAHYGDYATGPQPTVQRPERKSSREQRQTSPPPPLQGPSPNRPTSQRPPLTRPGSLQQGQPRHGPTKGLTTLDDMAAHPSPLPGVSSRTDSLSIIPTFDDGRKPEKKVKEEKEETRKTSWGWFRGGDDKEKREKDEAAKKSKSKLQKPNDRGNDIARLDVLQNSIDGPKGRESLVLDRSSIHLEEEKSPVRKTSSEKKEKESGLFSSLFGGGKKKGEKESGGKKGRDRGLSPDPPPRLLRPDIDYNWSRFSILEERAIYRMAHIKLANPRRELYSQVLLSNFMYSYLAKVQQMHPQMQLPQNPAQKKEMEKKQAELQKQQQMQQHQQQQQPQQPQTKHDPATPEEFAQYQLYQEVCVVLLRFV